MARSVEEGLALLDELERREELEEFHLLPAARANLLRPSRTHGRSRECIPAGAITRYQRHRAPLLRRRLTELETARFAELKEFKQNFP